MHMACGSFYDISDGKVGFFGEWDDRIENTESQEKWVIGKAHSDTYCSV